MEHCLISTELPDDIPDAIEEVSSHIHRCWYASRRIVAYEIFDISPDILQEWAELAVKTIQAWDVGQPYLALHDISRRGVAMKYSGLHTNSINPAITEDGKARLFPTPEDEANFQGRIALLVSLQFSGYLTRVLAATAVRQQCSENFQRRVFTEKIPALRWLASTILSE